MSNLNHTCKYCGKKYYACNYCDSIASWKSACCSIECFQEYVKLVEKERNKSNRVVEEEVNEEETVFDFTDED